MTHAKLLQILLLFKEAGMEDDFLSAEHDQIFLLPPDTIDPESEIGQKLDALGASYSEDDGWYCFT